MLSNTRAILFDLDDTLINDALGTQLALEQAWNSIESLCDIPPNETTQVIRNIASRLYRESPYFDSLFALGISSTEALYSGFAVESKTLTGLSEWSVIFQEHVWRDSLGHFNVTNADALQRLSDSYNRERIECISLLSDTCETLDRLSASYKLALVTNGPADLQSAKVSAAGLKRFFNTILISGQEGIGKPSPEFFHLALESLQVSPENAMMVGDSYSRDIVGAKNAGIRAIQLCHPAVSNSQTVEDSKPSVAIIHSIEELLPLLK